MSFNSFSSNSICLSVAILAGGQGVRMGGRKKGLLYVDGEPLVKRVVNRVCHLSNDILIITDRERVDSRCFGVLEGHRNIRFVEDTVRDIGPLGGLYTALLFSIYRYTFVCAVDMPFMNMKIVDRMLGALGSNRGNESRVCRIEDVCKAIVPVYEERNGKEMIEPLFSIYSKELVAELEGYIFSQSEFPERSKKRYSIHKFLNTIKNCCFLPVSDTERVSFTNINTVEDYIRYRGEKKLL